MPGKKGDVKNQLSGQHPTRLDSLENKENMFRAIDRNGYNRLILDQQRLSKKCRERPPAYMNKLETRVSFSCVLLHTALYMPDKTKAKQALLCFVLPATRLSFPLGGPPHSILAIEQPATPPLKKKS